MSSPLVIKIALQLLAGLIGVGSILVGMAPATVSNGSERVACGSAFEPIQTGALEERCDDKRHPRLFVVLALALVAGAVLVSSGFVTSSGPSADPTDLGNAPTQPSAPPR